MIIGPGTARAQTPDTQAAVLLSQGLRASPTCAPALEVVSPVGNALGCTHGPDLASFGVQEQTRDPQLAAAAVAAATVPCFGDGQSGNRVQAVYAYAAGTPDRYAQVADAIRGYAALANNVFANSAARTGARGVSLVTAKTGGYVLDGYRGIHPFSVAGNSAPTAATGGRPGRAGTSPAGSASASRSRKVLVLSD